MKLVSFGESVEWLSAHRIGEISSVVGRLDSAPSLNIEGDSCFLAALAREIVRGWPCTPGSQTLLLILEDDVFPTCGNHAMFEQYRSRETNPPKVDEFQGHLIETTEHELLEGLLCLSLYFRWGVLLADSSRQAILLTNHASYLMLSDHRGREENLSGFLAELMESRG